MVDCGGWLTTLDVGTEVGSASSEDGSGVGCSDDDGGSDGESSLPPRPPLKLMASGCWALPSWRAASAAWCLLCLAWLRGAAAWASARGRRMRAAVMRIVWW